MSDDSKIQRLVSEATQLPKEQRLDYLKEKTDEDQELIQQVTLILDEKEVALQVNDSVAQIDVKVGDHIGPYHILDEIGDGGMGKVFLVEQKQPVQRRVALKIIKLGMDTKDVLARFEMERQALALMSHPNVAAVYDAGITEAGRPYFVMEYVPGMTISQYADQYNLTIKQRIQLMIQTCRGVLHAHQKGILHRDLKPGNILVKEVDGKPIVKIIDFGVAKSTQQKLVTETLYTQLGVFIGTPNYTSPEQAGASPLDIDTRTDVYSLGVILYELLVGKLPFDPDTFHNKSLGEVQQIIREKDVPSAYDRLKTIRYARKNIARHRKSTFSELKNALKGDLNCIIMHAIEKDRIERYPSVSALESDLQNFLDGKPVQAQPHSVLYLTRRFIGRHKFMVFSVFAFVLALILGLATTLIALQRAEAEALNAKKQSVLASSMTQVMKELFLQADPWNQKIIKEITLLQAVKNLEDKIDSEDFLSSAEFSDLKDLKMDKALLWNLRKELGQFHLNISDVKSAQKNTEIALSLLQESPDENPLDKYKLEFQMVEILLLLQNYEEAKELFLKTVVNLDPPQNKEQADILLKFYSPRSQSIIPLEYMQKFADVAKQFYGINSVQYANQLLDHSEWHLDLIEKKLFDQPYSELVDISQIKDFKIAEGKIREALKIALNLTPGNEKLIYRAYDSLIHLLWIAGDFEEASEVSEKLIERSEKFFGENHIRTITAKISWVDILRESSSNKQALKVIEEIEPVIINYQNRKVYSFANHYYQKSFILFNLGRYRESRDSTLKAIDSNMDTEDIKYYLSYLKHFNSLSSYFLGDFEVSESLTLEMLADESIDSDYERSYFYVTLAYISLSKNDLQKAKTFALKSLELSSLTYEAQTIMAHVELEQGNILNSLNYFRNAKKAYTREFEIYDEFYYWLVSDLVLALTLNGHHQEALLEAREIQLGDSDTVYAAAIQLSLLAAQTIQQTPQEAKETYAQAQLLFAKIEQDWSDKIFQYHYARKALERIRKAAEEPE